MCILHKAYIQELSLDVLRLIIRHIDSYSLSALAQTNHFFYSIVQCEIGLGSVTWRHPPSLSISPTDFDANNLSSRCLPASPKNQSAQLCLNTSPPVYHMRCMARIGTKVFMPFMTPDPVCYVFDLITLDWEPSPRKICYPLSNQSMDKYQPFITGVAAVGAKIYMFGGRQVQSSTLSNSMYVLDINTFVLQKINYRGHSPQPRFDHSFDVLYNRYLIVFGGLCIDSSGENDLFLFDTKTDTWIEPNCEGQIPFPRYGHASVMVGHDLYVFGGTQSEVDGNTVYDMLYQLDCKTWIWRKFDHPEAQHYRRKLSKGTREQSDMTDTSPANQDISFSLEKDYVVETTGCPPRDRLQCSMVNVSNKLVLFGGQTIRQNREDTNVLHAYSICSVDVFDLRHRHWSKKCAKIMGIPDNIYPQDVCCFSVQDICDPRIPGQRMLVIGQQREFDMPAVSSGTTVSESIAGSIPESDSNRQSPSGSYQEGSGMSLQGNTAQGSEEDPINGYPYTSGGLYPRSNSPNCPGPSVPHYCHERSSLSLYRQPLGYNSYRVNVVYNYRESRPIADYDGILVNDIEYASDSYEPHWDFADHSPPGTPIPSQYEDSSFDPDNDRLPRIATDKPERDDRHYTSTFMCMTLTVNEQTIF